MLLNVIEFIFQPVFFILAMENRIFRMMYYFLDMIVLERKTIHIFMKMMAFYFSGKNYPIIGYIPIKMDYFIHIVTAKNIKKFGRMLLFMA